MFACGRQETGVLSTSCRISICFSLAVNVCMWLAMTAKNGHFYFYIHVPNNSLPSMSTRWWLAENTFFFFLSKFKPPASLVSHGIHYT